MSIRPREAEQDRIDREASAWLVRAEDCGLSHEDRRAFEMWRNADPRHAGTYDEMARTWADIPKLTGLASFVPTPLLEAYEPPLRSTRWRSFALAGFATVAAVLIAMLVLPTSLLQPGEQYRTHVAEVRIVTLPDGSSVTLGARSAISVKFTDLERRVVLSGGQALFDVAHASRPFLVVAGDSIVRDIGTKFDVNLSSSTVRVAVLEGKVAVSRKGRSPVPERLIVAGQGAEVALAASITPETKVSAADIVPTPAPAPGGWREGRLSYDNVRLADLVSDVNRYFAPGVELASPATGDLRITASFKSNEIPAFMASLGTTLPVHVNAQSGGGYRISDAH